VKLLVICFANTCRSPVAEALLRTALKHEDVQVSSRGLAGGPGDTPALMARALADANIELGSPSGESLTRGDAREADLLLFMERKLLRDAVVTDPILWPKSFTLREFARRALNNPPDKTSESFEQWRALLHSTRSRDELLGTDLVDDVPDPGLNGDEVQFAEMIESLRRDVAKVAPFLSGWPSTST
jgi:protein-tyrosine phosphatase